MHPSLNLHSLPLSSLSLSLSLSVHSSVHLFFNSLFPISSTSLSSPGLLVHRLARGIAFFRIACFTLGSVTRQPLVAAMRTHTPNSQTEYVILPRQKRERVNDSLFVLWFTLLHSDCEWRRCGGQRNFGTSLLVAGVTQCRVGVKVLIATPVTCATEERERERERETEPLEEEKRREEATKQSTTKPSNETKPASHTDRVTHPRSFSLQLASAD
jgi:hypothetical protein